MHEKQEKMKIEDLDFSLTWNPTKQKPPPNWTLNRTKIKHDSNLKKKRKHNENSKFVFQPVFSRTI